MSGSSGLIRDRWFLVLDPDYASSVGSSSFPKTIQSGADLLARRYQQNSNRDNESLGLGEVWSILNPFSIVQFLRFSMADVFWILDWLIYCCYDCVFSGSNLAISLFWAVRIRTGREIRLQISLARWIACSWLSAVPCKCHSWNGLSSSILNLYLCMISCYL